MNIDLELLKKGGAEKELNVWNWVLKKLNAIANFALIEIFSIGFVQPKGEKGQGKLKELSILSKQIVQM